jgi:hypothetical protein
MFPTGRTLLPLVKTKDCHVSFRARVSEIAELPRYSLSAVPGSDLLDVGSS